MNNTPTEQKANNDIKPKWKTLIRIGIAVFVLYLCIKYWSVVATVIGSIIGAASPLLIGCIIAYVINIIMSFYERKFFKNSQNKVVNTLRRPVCLVSALITLLAVVTSVFVLVLPQLISCIKIIIDKAPSAINDFVVFLENKKIISEDVFNFLKQIDWRSRIGELLGAVTTGIGSVVEVVFTAIYSVFSGVVVGVLSIIFAVYILLSKEKLGSQLDKVLNHYTNEKVYCSIKNTTRIFDECFHSYIVGQCVEAVILGVLCIIGMMILRLPYATMIGALIAFTALIPIAGAYIGAGIGAFLIVMVSPIKALVFIIFIIILQQIEGNLIYPKVVGSSIGLPSIWVLAAVTVGGGIFGIGGMLLGVPLAAALYHILRDNVNKGSRITRKADNYDSKHKQEC